MTKVFVLSGNHDSAERIAFGGRLMKGMGVYMSPVYNGEFAPVTLKLRSKFRVRFGTGVP